MEKRPILLFDVMGTLVHDPFYEELPAFFRMSFDELLAEKHPTLWSEFERGIIGEREMLEGFFRDRRPFDHEGLKRCIASAYRWLPGMETVLAELAAAGCAMHALSNYPSWYEWIEERLEISRFVPWTFVSCLTGVRKPAPEAYTGAVAELGVAPDECLLVDDRGPNCAAARACGLQAIRFRDAGELRRELARRGLVDPSGARPSG